MTFKAAPAKASTKAINDHWYIAVAVSHKLFHRFTKIIAFSPGLIPCPPGPGPGAC